MSKYISVDSNGNITGMYLTDPGDGIELDDEVWASIGPGYTYVNNQVVAPVEATASEKLAAEKQLKTQELSFACQQYLYSGFTSQALGAVYNYPSTAKDQQNLASSAAAGASAYLWCETGTTWSLLSHTAAQISQVNQDWVTYLNDSQSKLSALITSVNAAESVEALSAFNWS